MKTRIITVVIVSIFVFAGCGITISLNPVPSNDCNEKYNQCEQCKIQPRSGKNRDLRYGSYYDTKEKKCKETTYSTGDGCIPPPFKTLEECKACCCNL